MTITAIIPALICIAGLLAYALAGNPKVSEAGRLAFFAGLLVCCFVFAAATIHLGP